MLGFEVGTLFPHGDFKKKSGHGYFPGIEILKCIYNKKVFSLVEPQRSLFLNANADFYFMRPKTQGDIKYEPVIVAIRGGINYIAGTILSGTMLHIGVGAYSIFTETKQLKTNAVGLVSEVRLSSTTETKPGICFGAGINSSFFNFSGKYHIVFTGGETTNIVSLSVIIRKKIK
ncbi:hypothetical protein AMJ80_05965 [bacterium SM23_31]|nr:MAG: hypothetical protein AMJ80_05965 [bacterium SM23_31]